MKKGYKLSARYRGLPFELTDDEFDRLTASNCEYCGQPPSRIKKVSTNGSWTFSGIDRVDNSKGYINSNVVPCCSECNHAKSSMSLEAFLAWVDRLAKYHTKRPQPC